MSTLKRQMFYAYSPDGKKNHFLQLNEIHFQLIKFSDVMITQLWTAQVINRNVLTRDDNVWHVSSSLLISYDRHVFGLKGLLTFKNNIIQTSTPT